jgi:hypothetical protein
VLGLRFIRAKRAQSLGNEAYLTSETFDSRPLVPPGRFWPSTEVLICENGSGYELAYPGERRNGAQIIARMRQLANGNVTVRACEDLADLRAGERRVLEPGASELLLDETSVVSVSVGEKSLC